VIILVVVFYWSFLVLAFTLTIETSEGKRQPFGLNQFSSLQHSFRIKPFLCVPNYG